jgi:hypothetical protein
MRPGVTATVTIPGRMHNFELHGPPSAGHAYLSNGHAAVDLILGDRIEGTEGGRPMLTVETEAELAELEHAVRQMRERWSMWGADHRGDAA